MHQIPLVDLRAQYAGIAQEVEAAFRQVLAGMNLILGPELAAFEAEFAQYLGSGECVGVGSGIDALVLALRASGLQPGEEVLVPALTFAASANAVILAGGVPRFVDVDPETLLLDVGLARQALTPNTRVIMPVHLYGQMVPMDAVMALADEAGLLVVEDAAQAHGASFLGRKAGTWGHAGCFSFYPGKNLGAYGEAGAVITRDAAIAERIRVLRNQGARSKYEHVEVGCNSRMDELQAAVLRIKLRRLDEWNTSRRALAERYDRALTGSPVTPVTHVTLTPVTPVTPVKTTHGVSARHLYVVRTPGRDPVLRALQSAGIGAGVHYPRALPDQPALARFATLPVPAARRAADEVLSLPLFPELTADLQDIVVCELAASLATVLGVN